jgi:hypothetical protein
LRPPAFRSSTTSMKQPTRCQIQFKVQDGNVVSLNAFLCNFAPKYEILLPSMKFCTQVWNFAPKYEILSWRVIVLYPGMKFCTQQWSFGTRFVNLKPRHQTMIWNCIPSCITDARVCLFFKKSFTQNPGGIRSHDPKLRRWYE